MYFKAETSLPDEGDERWNICFLCTDPVTPSCGRETVVKPKKRKWNEGLSVGSTSRCSKLVLKYLLSNGGNSILDRINATDESGGNGLVKFCSKCNLLAEQLLRLHLELEVIQMKMVDKIKEAAEMIVNNSRLYGSNTESKEKIDLLQNMVNGKTPGEENVLEKKAEYLELLHDFQTFVFELDYRQCKVPLVFLRKLSSPFIVTAQKCDQMSATRTDISAEGGQGHFAKKEKISWEEDEPQLCDWNDWEMFDDLSVEDMISEETETKQTIAMTSNILRKANRGRAVSKTRKRSKTRKTMSAIQKDKTLKRRKVVKTPITSSVNRISERIAVKTAEKISLEEIKTEEPIQTKSTLDEALLQTVFTPAQELAMKLRRIPLKSAQLGKCKGTPCYIKRKVFFTCEACSFTARTHLGFYAHLLDHESEQDKSHSCPDCLRGFTQKQLMELHVMHICGDLGSKCDICAKSIAPIHMRSHLESDHSPSTTIYSCDHCHCCFANFISLVNHSEKHFRPTFKCPFCSNPKYFQRISIRRHLLVSHNMEDACNVMKCEEPHCGEVFYASSTYFKHREVFHKKKWACPECGILLKGQSSLDAHIQKTHRKAKRFVCDLCPSAYLYQTNLDIHKMNAHDAPKLKCDLCDKEFTTKKYLGIHRKRIHDVGDNPCWTCEVCSKQFYTIKAFKFHMLRHGDLKTHVCETCGFATKTRTDLLRHQKMHADTKPFQCPHCDKAFKVQSYLTDHIRIHTKERPFVCDACGRSFNQRSALSTHKKNQHPI